MKQIIVRFGKPHVKKMVAFKLDDLIFMAGEILKMSKSEVKRHLEQESVYLHLRER